MSVQAITGRISSSRVASGARRTISRKLNQLPHEFHAESKPKIKAEGSCGGMVSWSLNTQPVQREKIKAEGSCGGIVSWSLNTSSIKSVGEEMEVRPFCGGNASSGAFIPAQKGIKMEGSCAGMVSWSVNRGTAGQLLN